MPSVVERHHRLIVQDDSLGTVPASHNLLGVPPHSRAVFSIGAAGRSLAIVSALHLASGRALAADLGNLGAIDVRLDTSVRLSFGLRTGAQDPLLLAAINADDGDRAFSRGPISERADMATTLDLAKGDLAAEISADVWYDAAYHGPNDDRSPGTFNPTTVSADRFPKNVRQVMGGTIELGNAYVRGTFDAAGLPFSVSLGRQTLLWGESLFFAQNGIAGAQAPVDLVKIFSQPLIEARETYLPVTQVELRAQLNRALSLEAYDQLEWRRDRIPGVASYFSTSDVLDAGGERILLGGGAALLRARDRIPSGAGQFGAALRYDSGDTSLGLYALRYDAKAPEIQSGTNDTYQLVFPKGTDLVGLSGSTNVGGDTLSGEVSVRRHLPLASLFAPSVAEAPAAPASIEQIRKKLIPSEPAFATGHTVQALTSYEKVFSPGRTWDGAALQAEVSLSDLLGVERGSGKVLPRSTDFSAALRAVFTPTYYHLLRGWRIAVPIGAEVGLAGRSAVNVGQNAGSGSVTVGAEAAYRINWQFKLTFTHYIGSAKSQPLADRDFMTFSMARTF